MYINKHYVIAIVIAYLQNELTGTDHKIHEVECMLILFSGTHFVY